MGPSRTTTFCTAEDSSAARTSDVTALPTIGGTGPRLLSTNVTRPPATCRVSDVGQFVAHHVASDQRFPHTGLQQSGFRLEPDRNILDRRPRSSSRSSMPSQSGPRPE